MSNFSFTDTGWNVNYQRAINYELINSSNIFNPDNEALLSYGRKAASRRFVVVDEFIHETHGAAIEHYFEANHVKAKIVVLQSGEKNKSVESWLSLFRELDSFPVDRRGEPVIAIGGGVLTDLVGYVASCYRRGIPHIKVPTTLMGYVDASVGIKTGINFNANKNRMGSFEAPRAVILDKSFLMSLPLRHIINGMGEIVKLAVIKDKILFQLLEKEGVKAMQSKLQSSDGQKILNLSITGMIEELAPNLYEDNLERCVDFGHTFSPILEMYDVDNLLHGEAVAIDVAFSAVLANVRKLLSDDQLQRIFNLMKKLQLPYYHAGLKPDLLWEGVNERTYHRDGLQRIPLPSSIGQCVFLNDITYDDLANACMLIEAQCQGYLRKYTYETKSSYLLASI